MGYQPADADCSADISTTSRRATRGSRTRCPSSWNSPTWQDPTQKSAIFITFDEDYNNISTGIGNEGNHIVMVVIPSPGAVASGMRGGAFVADDYYNHYSLQRTIEESLGLPPAHQQ